MEEKPGEQIGTASNEEQDDVQKFLFFFKPQRKRQKISSDASNQFCNSQKSPPLVPLQKTR